MAPKYIIQVINYLLTDLLAPLIMNNQPKVTVRELTGEPSQMRALQRVNLILQTKKIRGLDNIQANLILAQKEE